MRQLTFVGQGQLEWWDVPEPQLEGPGQAIVRPIAVARCDVDNPILSGLTPFRGPFAFGHEFVAEIVTLGEEVRGFHPGQRVMVSFQISAASAIAAGGG